MVHSVLSDGHDASTGATAVLAECTGANFQKSPLAQVPSSTLQVYPPGQQCYLSLQQTASSYGQHPYSASEIAQQVPFPEHVSSDGQFELANTATKAMANTIAFIFNVQQIPVDLI